MARSSRAGRRREACDDPLGAISLGAASWRPGATRQFRHPPGQIEWGPESQAELDPFGPSAGNTKPGPKGFPPSFGSPALSGGMGEIRGFPPTPHDVFGFSGRRPTWALGLAASRESRMEPGYRASAISTQRNHQASMCHW